MEGGDEPYREQMMVAIFSAVIAVVPGMVMVVTQIIRNERTVLVLLETGKYGIALDLVLLVIGGMDMDRLTWDCRWYTSFWNPDHDRCSEAYSRYLWGVSILFVTQSLMLCHNVAFTECERKRVATNDDAHARANAPRGPVAQQLSSNAPRPVAQQISSNPASASIGAPPTGMNASAPQTGVATELGSIGAMGQKQRHGGGSTANENDAGSSTVSSVGAPSMGPSFGVSSYPSRAPGVRGDAGPFEPRGGMPWRQQEGIPPPPPAPLSDQPAKMGGFGASEHKPAMPSLGGSSLGDAMRARNAGSKAAPLPAAALNPMEGPSPVQDAAMPAARGGGSRLSEQDWEGVCPRLDQPSGL